jgi:hypothetical protein
MSTPGFAALRGAFFFCLCLLAAGCQSTKSISAMFHRHEAPAEMDKSGQQQLVLRPGTEVQWQVQATDKQPGLVKNGSGTLAPDGTVEVGPYGTCKLAGLNLTQATTALEKHLAVYMTTPSVQLSASVVDNPTQPAPAPASNRFAFFHHRLSKTAPSDSVASSGGVTNVGVIATGSTVTPSSEDADIQTVTWRPAQQSAR